MAILPALQSAAIRLVGRKPQTFFGASGVFEMEICDLANEVAQDISKYQDWQALISFASITGDGTTTAFNLPSDYERQLIDSDVQDATSWAWGYARITDVNQFRYLQKRGFTPFPGGWIIYDDQIHFVPAVTASVSTEYPYISKNLAKGTDGTLKPAFTADTDIFRLPERLLTLALVWRWRENKKLDFTGDMDAFTKALDEYAVKDRGSRVYRSNGGVYRAGVRTAWPWALG